MPGRCPLHDGAPASAYLAVAATGPQSSCPSLESAAFVKPVSRQGVACAVVGIGVLVHAAKVTASAAPIEDEAQVDARRRSIGMEPLADYAKRFGLDYVSKETKERPVAE